VLHECSSTVECGTTSLVRNGTQVRPDGRQPGGGTEYMTLARVKVEVLAVDNLE
jgi:hypothetical protein